MPLGGSLLGARTSHERAPLRQAAVFLHRRQIRSPAQALGNGDRQIRHFLIFCSVAPFGPVFSCRPSPCSSDVLMDSCPFPEAAHVVVNLVIGGACMLANAFDIWMKPAQPPDRPTRHLWNA